MCLSTIYRETLLLLVLVVANMLAATGQVLPIASLPPNIVYILADDLGYGDVGCYGQKNIRTPHLDALAAAGIRFTQHYAGAPVCAPSRAVLMTGRDVGHARVRGNYETGPHGFGAGLELRDEDVTLAEVLQQRGYTTALVGKWGLGVEGTTGAPNKQGFDYSFGFLNQGHAHFQFPEYLYRNGQRVPIVPNQNGQHGVYANNLFTEEALAFIEKNKTKPFFLYLAYTTPHAELLVPDDTIFASYKGKFAEKPHIPHATSSNPFGKYSPQPYPNAAYAASITHLDACVGKVWAFLQQHHLADNTLIIFSSDNGPAKEGGADPNYFQSSGGLRGKKRDLYEGGIRVPMLAVWPRVIQPAQISHLACGFQDLLPTLADASGRHLPTTIPTEGISLYPTLSGKGKQAKHPYLYWEFHENKTSDQALLRKGWKLIRHAPDGPFELYHLPTDLAETHNVAAQYPRIVRKLAQKMAQARTPHFLWPLKMGQTP